MKLIGNPLLLDAVDEEQLADQLLHVLYVSGYAGQVLPGGFIGFLHLLGQKLGIPLDGEERRF